MSAHGAQEVSSPPTPPFVRGESFEKFAAFETCAVAYQRGDHTGPVVWLVGAVHIGDAEYYERLEQFLDGKELVLFESVLPRGAFGASGATDAERMRSTQDAMLFLRGILERFARENGHYPESLAQARAFASGEDSRLARPFDLSCVDAWGRALAYVSSDDAYTLSSFGSDALPGGSEHALDLVLHERDDLRADAIATDAAKSPQHRKPTGDLYKELADALGVTLQVRSIDYDKRGWLPADLPFEAVLDRLDAKGVHSVTVEMLTQEDSLLRGVVRLVLSVASKLPDFKRIVIEALGSADGGARTSSGPKAGNSGEMSIIIDERNDAVLDRLRLVLQEPRPPASVAIFYGAAHMRHFDEKLRSDFGLVRSDGSLKAFRAMEVGELSIGQLQSRLRAATAALTGAEEWTSDRGGKKPSAKRLAALRDRVRHYQWRVERAAEESLFSASDSPASAGN